jgi:glycosyltransferase involved in cell wall biosynthesis
MKSILIISCVFHPEPVVSAKLSFDIANVISQNFKTTVVSPLPSRPYGFSFDKINNDYCFDQVITSSYTCPKLSLFGRFKESYSFGECCYKYLLDNYKDINVIYANTWPLFSQYFIIKAARKFNIPIIIHVQDIYPESLNNKMPCFSIIYKYVLLPIDRFILGNATRIIAISENMKDYLVRTRNLNNCNVEVIQNWQDEEDFIKFHQIKLKRIKCDNPFTFMYLGNIGPVAGADLLIDSFAKVKLENCRLIIAGSGSMKEHLVNKAKEYKASKIEFLSVPDGKVPEIQSQADVLLLPIKKGAALSSIPSKLSAYMFSSKPIIACVDETSDTAATIISAKCGWIVSPQNIDALTKKMMKVISLPKEELQKLGENGFNYAMKNLSKKSNLPKVMMLINELVSK